MRLDPRRIRRAGPSRHLSIVILTMLSLAGAAVASAQPHGELDAALRNALDAPAWVQLPRPIVAVRHSGPTPAAGAPGGWAPGPVWYLTRPPGPNSRPHVSEQQERAFVRSVEAAHAGRTQLVEGGEVLLVDPDKRIWAVAEHMPHVLRCYDGKGWTYKRADGLPADADEPAAFARLAREGKLAPPDYAKGGLRNLNDMGRWYDAACADAAGNLHFFASCVSADAERRGAGGGGVHTRRPDGGWSFFRIYPGEFPPSEMPLDGLRCVIHAPARPAGAKRDGAAAGRDLVTVADFRLSDPVAESHGHKVLPIPPGAGELWHQRWTDRTVEPRSGPRFFLRFDGKGWRFDRSVIGFGVYDDVFRSWPQPDGTIYLANRFGLWVQWPRHVTSSAAERDRLIGEMLGPDEAKAKAAAGTLASMGAAILDGLNEAAGQASSDRARARLNAVRAEAARVARGEEDAAPVVAARWRFIKAYPQATMPDGRFAFHSERVIDVRDGRELADCAVFFDPSSSEFEVRPLDRAQWRAAGVNNWSPGQPPVNAMNSVVDRDGGLWMSGGYRLGGNGQVNRVVPPGLKLDPPRFVDPDGRVYCRVDAPNQRSLVALRPDAAGNVARVKGADGAAAEAEGGEGAEGDGELIIERVRALFRQPDVAPPWNAWAVRERDGGAGDLLLRLDGPKPKQVERPDGFGSIGAVVPLDGGCVAVSREAAGFWDGDQWHVAPTVKALVERHGARLAKMAPAYAFAADTSRVRHGQYEQQLFLASDGRGGLWLAEDARGERGLWHWDGQRFTDLWTVLPLPPKRGEDGVFATAERGRALVVQIEQDFVRPGGYWAVWRVTQEDLAGGGGRERVPQTAHAPGLHPTLLAALGPNTLFSRGLWVDRQGWVWSPIFSEGAGQWVRRRDARVGFTPLPTAVWADSFVQPADGPAWCLTGKMGDAPRVWADVSPVGDQPKTYARETWVGAEVNGMGAAARLAVGPGNRVYLLHEGGCSLLRLHKLEAGEQPKARVSVMRRMQGPRSLEEMEAFIEAARARRAPQTRPTSGRATVPAAPTTRPAAVGAGPGSRPGEDAGRGWEIREVARREWHTPRNDFARVAFDETGVWVLPEGGPLMRAPLPRE